MDAIQIIKQYKLVPVVVFQSADEAVPVLTALKNGGLPIAEITFRTAAAAGAIAVAAQKFSDMLIGAGTVINAGQCKEAIAAGARFIVGPGFSEEVCAVSKAAGVPYIPGTVTPTEMMQALKHGLTLLKMFPADSFGGLKTIRSLSAAFPQVSFMPTGGVTADNISEFLAFKPIVACGGSFMMKGSPADIEKATREVMKKIGENQ